MPNSYEHSYQHDLDNVIDASDAVLAIGTEKKSTTELLDRSLNNNDATIHGAMRASGYFDGGRRFDDADDYLDLNTYAFDTDSIIVLTVLYNGEIKSAFQTFFSDSNSGSSPYIWIYRGQNGNQIVAQYSNGVGSQADIISTTDFLSGYDNKDVLITIIIDYTNKNVKFIRDGVLISTATTSNIMLFPDGVTHKFIGLYNLTNHPLFGKLKFAMITTSTQTQAEYESFFNTLARLPLYSHNFERYPNSDTSLTSIFPYTSGIITSGSFNKTDGLKCTSAGTVVFSNSFEFDGSEYLTLVINGVEYSGTTTVTQGTITATIAQGSNDITI